VSDLNSYKLSNNLSLSISCKTIVLCPNNDVNDQRNSEVVFKETVKVLKSFGLLFQDSGYKVI